MKRFLALSVAALMTVMILSGCSKTEDKTSSVSESPAPPYFTKGVFLNTEEGRTESDSKYYYIFNSETEGHTDDGVSGLPFACEQKDGGIWFSFGGMDPESEDFLTIEFIENGIVKGHFKDGKMQEFSPVSGADPDTFDAANYHNAAVGKDLVYTDANGWSVKYDPNLFTINGGGPEVSFVYTGESAGTNMITASYNVGKDAKTAIADLAEEWGGKSTISEGIFPGTEDVTGYWATLPPEKEGSGLYSTAIARDYMDGYLLFELTGHNSGDDEADMAVSDSLAGIIDSLEFETP